ncbi:SIMPL domain-containing protein [Komagataeibacter sp. FNDCF1]|uniref:SIMPL domain-containing protein n=1 Tax=Komagataeibacter sp. FNDCF1 TaxID=2878681 RepID=UPI001E399E9C|nr:SIMPL domain-containing protein [Komagataeibacter sp. FNDCF1]MCE2564875.1 SIMPL domain-containing protein [Komagataeibacter sp. FNDCF1]
MKTSHFHAPARRMLPALAIMSVGTALYPLTAMAQRPIFSSATASSTPTLELSASGTVHAQPDELTAVFYAESRADTAAAAQAQVNALASKAIATAGHADGVSTNAESYFVHHEDGDPRQPHRPPQWVARQTIRLTATEGKGLLPLVAQLQGDNLVLTRLDWSLSASRRADLTRQAETLALQDMQQRAQAAAETLKLKIGPIRTVTLDDQNFPRPMPMMMMARAASVDVPPPEAPAAMQDVTATVHAVLTLQGEE